MLGYSVSAHRSSTDKAFSQFVGRANRRLHWEDITRLKSQGLALLDLGGWHEGGDDQELLRINRFKEEFGGEIVENLQLVASTNLEGADWYVASARQERPCRTRLNPQAAAERRYSGMVSKPPLFMLAYVYPPDNYVGAARPARFVKYLQRAGYSVSVIAAGPDEGCRTEGSVFRVQGEMLHAPRKSLLGMIEKAARILVLSL